jgi:hypothetical protein
MAKAEVVVIEWVSLRGKEMSERKTSSAGSGYAAASSSVVMPFRGLFFARLARVLPKMELFSLDYLSSIQHLERRNPVNGSC